MQQNFCKSTLIFKSDGGSDFIRGLVKALTGRNIAAGWMYFYIHFAMEVLCFFCLKKEAGSFSFMWLFPFAYDILAFVPQAVVGYLNDRFPRFKAGFTGILLMAFAALSFALHILPGRFPALVILCAGNCLTHVSGAEVTLRSSGGRLSHPAIFVSGGAFGVITGTLLAQTDLSYYIVILFLLTAIPFSLAAENYKQSEKSASELCRGYDCVSDNIPPAGIIAVSFIIVALRSYMGFCLPLGWKNTVADSILLYCAMGLGKAAGGILADAFGVKKVALISAAAALPFILAGNRIMIVSLIGIMPFSMTMSITLAMLVSVLKNAPGLAFGYTTIALTAGVVPVFFFNISSYFINSLIISALTAVCLAGIALAVRKDERINA